MALAGALVFAGAAHVFARRELAETWDGARSGIAGILKRDRGKKGPGGGPGPSTGGAGEEGPVPGSGGADWDGSGSA